MTMKQNLERAVKTQRQLGRIADARNTARRVAYISGQIAAQQRAIRAAVSQQKEQSR